MRVVRNGSGGIAASRVAIPTNLVAYSSPCQWRGQGTRSREIHALIHVLNSCRYGASGVAAHDTRGQLVWQPNSGRDGK